MQAVALIHSLAPSLLLLLSSPPLSPSGLALQSIAAATMSSDEFKEQLLQACRNIGNNLRTIGAALGLLGWLCTVAGCIMIWHHYYATTESTVIDNAVTNYYIILAFCVPILNLFAFLTEITIVHFLVRVVLARAVAVCCCCLTNVIGRSFVCVCPHPPYGSLGSLGSP